MATRCSDGLPALGSFPEPTLSLPAGDPLLDGLPAELAAAARLRRNAESLFWMKAAPGASAQEAATSAEALRALATGWEERFGAGGASVERRAADAALAAAATVALAGLAFRLSGGESVLAPIVANAVATCDAYTWGADPDAGRANVRLPVEACGRTSEERTF